MYPISLLLRFFCFDILYMIAKGVLDLFWGYPIDRVIAFEFMTTLAIIPFFIAADMGFQFFEKRKTHIYLYDSVFLILSLPFIAALLGYNPNIQVWLIRAVHMLINRNEGLVLYLPLLPAVVLGYFFYGWTLKMEKTR
ncbi:MAG TPA: hypothetical protein VN963_02715 [bacterium]|nr:hypothetical protein [bacterium]